MKYLPLPPVFGCALINHPPSVLAKRFMETKVPLATVHGILGTGGGEALLGNEWVMISNDKVATIYDPRTRVSVAMAEMEAASAV